MKKASQVVLIINGVLALISAAFLAVASVLFFVFSQPQYTQMIVDGINNGSIHSSIPGTPLEVAQFVQFVFIIIGGVFIPAVVFALASAILSFVARKENTSTALYIVVMVVSFLSGQWLGFIGGILGLVSKE